MNEHTDEELSWDNVYLLGWYGEDGRQYLTSWVGDLPYVYVYVTGSRGMGPPLWSAPVTRERVFRMPGHLGTFEEKIAYAKTQGGLYAFGWWQADGVTRTTKPKS